MSEENFSVAEAIAGATEAMTQDTAAPEAQATEQQPLLNNVFADTSEPVPQMTTEPTAPAVPELLQDAMLVQRAQLYGLTQAEYLALGTPETARKSLDAIELANARFVQSMAARNQTGQEAEPQSQKEPVIDDLPELGPEYDEGARAVFNKYREKIISQQNLLDRVSQRMIQSDAVQQEALIDAQFTNLGDSYAPLVGKGSIRQINDPAQQENRMLIYDAYNQLKSSPVLGRKPQAELFQMAADAIVGKQVFKGQRDAQTSAIRAQAKAKIGTPGAPRVPMTADAYKGDLRSHPALTDLFNELSSQNGLG